MKIVDTKDFGPFGFNWMTLTRIAWEDKDGRVRFWESAQRTTRTGTVDGVAIIAKVLKSGQPPHILVISQFRPPLGNHCLELPAGLVDIGEDVTQTAIRELLEETGYVGRVVEVSPISCSDPGMTSANMQIVTVEVDGDAPRNQDVVPNLDDGEFVTTTLVPMHGLLQYLLETKLERGWEVDARLLAYATGLNRSAGATSAAGSQSASASSAPPTAELSGSGSPVKSGDAELDHAVEAALKAGRADSSGGGSVNKVETAVPGAVSMSLPQHAQHSPADSSSTTNGWADSTLSQQLQKSGGELWRDVKRCVCCSQFGLGLATGLTAAAVVWKCR